jgi:hypothetical protein
LCRCQQRSRLRQHVGFGRELVQRRELLLEKAEDVPQLPVILVRAWSASKERVDLVVQVQEEGAPVAARTVAQRLAEAIQRSCSG